MFVEVVYGLISNSLGLLSDGAHMLLDCSAILIGLYSSYLSDKNSDSKYNFGYKRSEVLGTFVNSVFLVFISLYIVFESIERFIQPLEIHADNIIIVSVLGLIVNLIGVYFFHDMHHGHSHGSCSGHSHNHEDKGNHNHDHGHKTNDYSLDKERTEHQHDNESGCNDHLHQHDHKHNDKKIDNHNDSI